MDTPKDRLNRYKRALNQIQLRNNPVPIIETDKLHPFQKLDLVLEYFETIKEPPVRIFTDISQDLRLIGVSFGAYSDELFRILHKLESDKLIDTEIIGGIKHYRATFDGNLFLSQGSYYQKHLDTIAARSALEIQNDRNRVLNKMASYGSMGAAIAALFLLILEAMKFFSDPDNRQIYLLSWIGIVILFFLLRKVFERIFP